MTTKSFELDCGNCGNGIVEIDGDDVLLHYDREAEAAAQALGFEPGLCYQLEHPDEIDLEALDDVSLPIDRMLFLAAEAGHAQLVRFLLDAGAHPTLTTFPGNTPADWAAYSNRDDAFLVLVTWLIDHGLDVRWADYHSSAWVNKSFEVLGALADLEQETWRKKRRLRRKYRKHLMQQRVPEAEIDAILTDWWQKRVD